jgi:hypothetical protein
MSTKDVFDADHAGGPVSTYPRRIALLFVGFENANLAAFRYLILQLNRLQKSFEYEITPQSDDSFFARLSPKRSVDRNEVKNDIPRFSAHYLEFLESQNLAYGLKEEPATYYLAITLARFTDDYYSTRRANVSVLALGSWKSVMAPPSILEFIITLVMRESVASISPSIRGSVHLGTKGCLFDFTPGLDEVRLKVLSGFVCSHCVEAMRADGLQNVTPELITVLGKAWLGEHSDSDSPAAVTAKLGYNLFATKGLKASVWEKAAETLQTEGVKTLITFVSAVGVAYILFVLGLKP